MIYKANWRSVSSERRSTHSRREGIALYTGEGVNSRGGHRRDKKWAGAHPAQTINYRKKEAIKGGRK